MPRLKLKGADAYEDIPDDAITEALATGLYEPPGADVRVPVVVDGFTGQVAGDDFGTFRDTYGAREESEAEFRERERQTRIEREHGGALGAAATFLEQGLDTATFGGYGAATDLLLGDDYTENRRERLEVHDEIGTAATVAGAVLPGILSGGSGAAGAVARATPAGIAARIGEGIAARGAERGAIAATATAAAGYGVEGALFGAGQVLSETILDDRELSGEAFVAGAANGALWGGVAGGGATLLSRGTKAVRSRAEKMIAEGKSDAELDAFVRDLSTDLEQAKKQHAKLELDNSRSLNRRAEEEVKQKGRLEVIETRGKTSAEIEELRTAKKLEAKEFETEQKLKLLEYQQGGKEKLANIGAEAKLRLAEEQGGARLAIADKKLQADIAKSQAKIVLKQTELDAAAEQLAIQRERTARAQLVMDKRLELADKYGGHWRAVNESKEAQQGLKLAAADVSADARIRTGLADSMVRSGRKDAGVLVEELIPARMRNPKAIEGARAQAFDEVARLASKTDDLARRVDDIITTAPGAADELRAVRARASETVDALEGWGVRARSGVEDFGESFKLIRAAEEAQHDLAQAARPFADDVTAPAIDDVLRGMDDAVEVQREVLDDAVVKQAEAMADPRGGLSRMPDEPPPVSPMVDDAITAEGANGASAKPGRPAAGQALDDLALFNEVASLAGGAGVNVEDVPVIGPAMKWYLKYRALRGGLNKLGFRGAGPVARIAQTGAKVQNRAAETVATMLKGAEAGVTKSRASVVSVSGALGQPLWEPDEEPARRAEPEPTKKRPADPVKLYQKRADELGRAVADIEATRRRVVESVPAPPRLANSIADAQVRKLQYLAEKMPKDPRPPIGVGAPYRPNPAELRRFAETVRAVEDPIGAMADVADGLASPAAAQAVRDVYPRLFAQMQQDLVDRMAEEPETVRAMPYDRKVRVSLAFDIPLDHSLTKESMAARQAEYAPAQQAAQAAKMSGGGSAAAPKLSALEETGLNRRMMR